MTEHVNDVISYIIKNQPSGPLSNFEQISRQITLETSEEDQTTLETSEKLKIHLFLLRSF